MTLADILKPSLTVMKHAELRGLQFGAGIGTLFAIPAILIRPTLLNPKHQPPVVAIANTAGIGALTGATVVTLAFAYKMSKLSKAGIVERAHKISANVEQKRVDTVAGIGASLGTMLVIARVIGLSRNEGRCVYGILFRRQTLWEVFTFGVMGAAVSVGVFAIGKKVYRILDSGVVEVNEIDEGDVDDVKKKEVQL